MTAAMDKKAIRPVRRRPPGWRAVLLYAGYVLCATYTLLFLLKIPAYYIYLRDSCLSTDCSRAVITPLPAETVAKLGLSAEGFAGIHTGITLGITLIYLSIGVIILRKRPNETISWLAALALISFHTSSFISVQWEELGWAAAGLGDLSTLFFILFLLLFPNGNIVSKPIFWAALLIVCLRLVAWHFPGEVWGSGNWPIGVTLVWMLLLYGLIIWNQYIRYRYYASAAERQQSKWAMFGVVLSIVALIVVSVIPLLFDGDFYQTSGSISMFILDIAVQIVMLPIPVTLGISMLKKRLWDIDPIANRTIVYAFLSAILIALYSLVVWYLSLLFQTGLNMIFSMVGAGLVAVLFAPLKERLHRLVNRIIYGGPQDPFSVLEQLAARLHEPSSPDDVLNIVVKTVRDSLRLPYAAVSYSHHGTGEQTASVGERTGEAAVIPLQASGQNIGALHVCTRSPEEPFSEEDWKMLQFLARQAATVVQGLKQSLDIQMLAGDLQETREKLIFAREEERRSMRRNLHDDIAPRLAAMRLTSSLAVDWIRKDPNKAIEIMDKFKQDIGDTVEEIRGIVYDLRPQALDELGLKGALQQRIEQIRHIHQVKNIAPSPPLTIELEAPNQLPILPAAVEVGAYRIVTEALTNVAKHAAADFCRVLIAVDEEDAALLLEISDNGIGIEEKSGPPEAGGGLGLYSIRERAEELGGTCRISRTKAGGTLVTARLPLRTKVIGKRGMN